MTVGVWLPGQGHYVRSFGVADKRTGAPMTDDLYMRIGSETKTFTATVVLELVDDGLIGLDDPVSAHVSGVPHGDRITVRDLAEMRSGLFPYSSDPGFVTALESDPTRPSTPQELLAYGYKHPNVAAPGTQAQRTDFLDTGLPGAGYGLGLFDVQGWVGHNGSLPGYESLTIYMPETGATLVVLLNTDILTDGIEPSTLFGQALTSIVTRDNVYFIPAVK